MSRSPTPDPQDAKLAQLLNHLTEQLREGGSADWEECARQHPEFADELRHMLPAMQLLMSMDQPATAAGSLTNSVNALQSDDMNRRRLGDFRILREIGRGGMGVVYEAEQLLLGRTVAVKVLPCAALLDERALKRFQNEARAAATLEHPHIVPVYSVGSDRGIYYYSMSLVRGLSLAEIIRAARQRVTEETGNSASSLELASLIGGGDSPKIGSEDDLTTVAERGDAQVTKHRGAQTQPDIQAAISTHRELFTKEYFRQAARLGAQAAEALHHAHIQGIVHRDIKPSNLLVDHKSQLWVTDFGLARIESDPGVTMTGDLVGTLRYMAPEQALAKRIVVDHRADIYGLGATLYELIALHPLCDGKDKKQILGQIAFEEPKSLKSRNRWTPRELETTILRSVSKNPDDRYASAQEMADDLRAFLDDRPIKAKPPTVLNRLSRWGRRNRLLVSAVAGVLLLATMILAVSVVLIDRQRQIAETSAESAIQERNAARAARQEEREARRQEQGARKNAQTSLDLLVDSFRSPDPELYGRDIKVVDALEQAEQRIAREPDEELRALLLASVGRTYLALGLPSDSQRCLEEAYKINFRILGPSQFETLDSMHYLALACNDAGNFEKAVQLRKQALELAMAGFGKAHFRTLRAMNALGCTYLSAGRKQEAIGLLETVAEAAEIQHIQDDASFSISLGNPAGEGAIGAGPAQSLIFDDESTWQFGIGDPIAMVGAPHYRGAFVQGLPGAHFNPLTFGPDGNIYTAVGTGPGYDLVERFDGLTGEFMDYFIVGDPTHPLSGVRDIVFHPSDGKVYVANAYTNEVLRYDVRTGDFVDVFVAAGSGGIEHPDGMMFGPDANNDGHPELYVTGVLSHSVVRYDGATGAPLGNYVNPGSGGLSIPFSLAFHGPELFVTSAGTDAILKYDAETGNYLGVAATEGLSYPRGLTFGPDGLMYVTSGDNDRIIQFTADGRLVGDFVPPGAAGLEDPRTPRFGPDGDLYVTVTGKNEIMRFCGAGRSDRLALAARINLAAAYRSVGRLRGAVELGERVLREASRLLGSDHPLTLVAKNTLGTIYWAIGRNNQALAVFREVVRDSEAALGDDHRDTLLAQSNLAAALAKAGELEASIELSENVIAHLAATLGPAHPRALKCKQRLVATYRDAGLYPKAIDLAKEVLQQWREAYGDSDGASNALEQLAEVYSSAKQYSQAVEALEETVALRRSRVGEVWLKTLRPMRLLADAYRTTGNTEKALALYTKVLSGMREKLGNDHHETRHAIIALGICHVEAAHMHEAIPLLEEFLAGGTFACVQSEQHTLEALGHLAAAYADVGRTQDSKEMFDKALQFQQTNLSRDNVKTANLLRELGMIGTTIGRFEQAIELVGEAVDLRKSQPEESAVGWKQRLADLEARTQPARHTPPSRGSAGSIIADLPLQGPFLNDHAHFGRSVAWIGDVDGDGVGDLAVGSRNDRQRTRGEVRIFFLNRDGSPKRWTKIAGDDDSALGLDDGDLFGISLAPLGDLNGDGIPDLAVGARQDDTGGPDRGAVYLLFLNADGSYQACHKIASDSNGGPPLADRDCFGNALCSLGDLNQDGVTDIAVGAPGDDTHGTDRGALYILFLNAAGTVQSHVKLSGGGGAPELSDSAGFGWSAAALKDLDGDGVVEIAVAAPGDDTGGDGRGAVYVMFLKTDGGVKRFTRLASNVGGCPSLDDDQGYFGAMTASLGDVNGDGVGDLAVGSDDMGKSKGMYVLLLDSNGAVRKSSLVASRTDGGMAVRDDIGFGISATLLDDQSADGVTRVAVGAWHDNTGGPERGAVHLVELARRLAAIAVSNQPGNVKSNKAE